MRESFYDPKHRVEKYVSKYMYGQNHVAQNQFSKKRGEEKDINMYPSMQNKNPVIANEKKKKHIVAIWRKKKGL